MTRRRQKEPDSAQARLTGVIGVGVISFSAIFVRLGEVSPVTTGFFRSAYALPVLWILWRLQRKDENPPRRQRLIGFGAGLALGADFAAWHNSIEYIGAGLATVLGNVQVIVVGLAAWPIFGERPTRRGVVATGAVMAGVVLVSGLGQDDAFGRDPALGVAFGLLTGAFYATFLLAFRYAAADRTPSGPLLDATAGAAVASLLLSVTDSGFSLVPSWPAHGWLLALAMGSQVLGWLIIASTFRRLTSLEISVLLVIQPTLSVLWARLIFSEVFSGWQWWGLVLVLGGVAVTGGRAAQSGSGGTGRS